MRSAKPFALLVASFSLACGGGPPGRPSPALSATSMRLPDGAHALDLRASSPAFAIAGATGEEEVHDLSGRLAPPIPGHEREAIRALRVIGDGLIWACIDGGPALFSAGSWTFLDLVAASPRDLDPTGTCNTIDARSATEMYLGWGRSVCAWELGEWDCYQFAALAEQVSLTEGHLWFVQTPARYDDLLVVDTVTRATPTLIRLGDADTTGVVLPVPGAEQVAVTHWAGARGDAAGCDTCGARLVDPDGNFADAGGAWIVPLGPDDRYVLSVLSAGPLACEGGMFPRCGVDDAWSQLVVSRVTGGATTEVGHLAVAAPGGVPAWALRDDDSLLVPDGELFTLP